MELAPGSVERRTETQGISGTEGAEQFKQYTQLDAIAQRQAASGVQQTKDAEAIRRSNSTATLRRSEELGGSQTTSQSGELDWSAAGEPRLVPQPRRGHRNSESWKLRTSLYVRVRGSPRPRIQRLTGDFQDCRQGHYTRPGKCSLSFLTYINRGAQSINIATVSDKCRMGSSTLPEARVQIGALRSRHVHGKPTPVELHWMIDGQLTPGESGVVWYQVVRMKDEG